MSGGAFNGWWVFCQFCLILDIFFENSLNRTANCMFEKKGFHRNRYIRSVTRQHRWHTISNQPEKCSEKFFGRKIKLFELLLWVVEHPWRWCTGCCLAYNTPIPYSRWFVKHPTQRKTYFFFSLKSVFFYFLNIVYQTCRIMLMCNTVRPYTRYRRHKLHKMKEK